MTDVDLTDKEQKASDAILAVMTAIKDLSEEDRGVYNFKDEVVPAIHKLQMFVLMHWAHRINPDAWSNWYDMPLPPKTFEEIMDDLDNMTAK